MTTAAADLDGQLAAASSDLVHAATTASSAVTTALMQRITPAGADLDSCRGAMQALAPLLDAIGPVAALLGKLDG